jgi:hypothetical protein
VNIDHIKNKQQPQVLASASRIDNERTANHRYSFTAKSPINTTNISRILLPNKPRRVLVGKHDMFLEVNWDTRTKTYLLEFENSPDGVQVDIEW